MGCEVRSRRPLFISGIFDYLHPRRYVFLLYADCNGTESPEIFVVEKISNNDTNGSVCCCLCAFVPAADLESMRFSNRVCLFNWFSRFIVPSVVHIFLCESLQGGQYLRVHTFSHIEMIKPFGLLSLFQDASAQDEKLKFEKLQTITDKNNNLKKQL